MKIRNPIQPPENLEDLPTYEKAMASWVKRSHAIHAMGGLAVARSQGRWMAGYAEVSPISWKTVRTVRRELVLDTRFDVKTQFEWAICDSLSDFLMRVESAPDVIFVNGDGINHPSHFGLACHVGVLLDIPTVGILDRPAKHSSAQWTSRRGNCVTIESDNRGATLNDVFTQDNEDPIQVSIGHRVDISEAIKLVLQATPIYRVPHPLIAATELAVLAP